MRKFVAYQRQTQNLNPEPKSQENLAELFAWTCLRFQGVGLCRVSEGRLDCSVCELCASWSPADVEGPDLGRPVMEESPDSFCNFMAACDVDRYSLSQRENFRLFCPYHLKGLFENV